MVEVMATFLGVLAVEGQPTTDGRLIAHGALRWPDHSVPLTADFGGKVIGEVSRIWRDGNLIRCEGTTFDSLDAGQGLAVGCTIDKFEADMELATLLSGDGEYRITSGEIGGAAITDEPAFLDARVEGSSDE